MIRSVIFAAACCLLPAAEAWAVTPAEALAELRRSFTVGGKPVPPRVFADFGDDDLADSTHSIWVTVDLLGAIGSNLYAAPIANRPNGWLVQKAGRYGTEVPGEQISYRYVGATRSGLMLVIASFQTAGSGAFVTLHVLDAAPARGLDEEGKSYDRLDLTVVRNIPLGDRWRGEVKIDGDRVVTTTMPGPPNNSDSEIKTATFEARRP